MNVADYKLKISCLSLPETALCMSYLLMSFIIIFIYNLVFLKAWTYLVFFSPVGAL